jgi:peroxin-10
MSTTSEFPVSSPSASIAPYPFAAAPDIIRAHQKDVYFQGQLTNQISDLHRRLLGARSAHSWATEACTAADLLYLSLTTLIGNRTLGEEYCDVVQVRSPSGRLPSLRRRASYIAGSVLLPYALGRLLPGFRTRIKKALEARLRVLSRDGKGDRREARVWQYIIAHLGTITSGAPLHALTLAMFYFSGTYYEVAKRVLGLRYVFTRKVPDTPDRAGYEVLGVLLVAQMAVQAYLHIRSTLGRISFEDGQGQQQRQWAGINPSDTVDVSLSENAYSANNELLLSSDSGGGHVSRVDIAATTHTPVSQTPRYDLSNDKVMRFIAGSQQRKCTLCLEEFKDPAATQCGHVFCWTCIGDWVREKPECPLCRREAMVQHILPLRVI